MKIILAIARRELEEYFDDDSEHETPVKRPRCRTPTQIRSSWQPKS